MNLSLSDQVVAYHERTKHHLNRFAPSPGYMDWANQPIPYREYKGATSIQLPFIKNDLKTNYHGIYDRELNKIEALTPDLVGAFLELSLGLSAWKELPGSRWALRINPSSGNLHPTEAYLVLPDINETLSGGVYHYNPYLHILEKRASAGKETWNKINEHFKSEGFIAALSSIYWREAWKYGERAFRYCQHDIGHAIASFSFSANLLGWKVTCLNSQSDDTIETLLGFDKTKWHDLEQECAEVLFYVHPSDKTLIPRNIPHEIIEDFKSFPIEGTPNRLSNDYVEWEVIENVRKLTRKPLTEQIALNLALEDFVEKEMSEIEAVKIFRQRRSAVDFDGETSVTKQQFYAMLDKTLPRRGCAPYDVEVVGENVDLLIFVHRVEGLDAGLYLFNRNPRHLNEFKQKTDPHLKWQKAENGLPLYLLKTGDFQGMAEMVSCGQSIAGSSAFSLGMLSWFKKPIESHPFIYKDLFWETGIIGQILYLEAEAHGLRSTGIGCFFDDEVHKVIGLMDNTFQSLYHFTVGGAIEDPRLMTYPPYFHLKKKK